jgi:hypothetical protein
MYITRPDRADFGYSRLRHAAIQFSGASLGRKLQFTVKKLLGNSMPFFLTVTDGDAEWAN